MRTLAHLICLLLPLALAECGGDPPPPAEPYTALDYDYLPKLRLNVATLNVVDHSQPEGDNDVAATSPAVPAEALARMAHERLVAVGFTGSATFVIDHASIVRDRNGVLTGQLGVHLEVTGANGLSAGIAEARVARQHIPGSDPENDGNNLYDITRQMMDDMNVEIVYQIKASLPWLLSAPVSKPAPVQAQPLAPPPAPPPPDAFVDPAAPAPAPQMSPPPGYLQPPPGTTPGY